MTKRIVQLAGVGVILTALTACGSTTFKSQDQYAQEAVAPETVQTPSTDDLFISNAQDIGVPTDGAESQLIALGHAFCDDFAAGNTFAQEMYQYDAASIGEYISAKQYAQLIGSSIAAYCPQYSSVLDGA